VLRPSDADASVAVVLLAGYCLSELPDGQPRITLVNCALDLGREGMEPVAGQLDDTLLSRRHARISRLGGVHHVLQDLGSTNGTWLDGIRVQPGAQHALKEGSAFLVGGQVFVFRHVTPDELAAIREDLATPFGPVPTLSPAMAVLTRKLRRLATAKVDLLLAGEAGTGKQVLAEALHRASGRTGPFLAFDCTTLPEGAIEGELFGRIEGDVPVPGLLERADGGTLFLDELGVLPATAQARLARFLPNRQLLAHGASRARTLDVRIVAATSATGGADLDEDLAARIGPATLTVPPLRDRAEDIGMLVDLLARDRLGFVPEAYLALFLHTWKGNIRELEKAVTVAQVLAAGEPHVDLDHLPTTVAARIDAQLPTSRRRRRPTREELVEALARHGGDVADLARELGRQRTLVWRWLREHEIRAHDFRS
jgi:DNA-binding NtrC family response regulator